MRIIIIIINLFFFAGIGLLFFKKKEAIGKSFVIIAFVLLLFLGFTPFSNFLVWNLEKQYPPLKDFIKIRHINYIVLLTAWDDDNPDIPYTSKLGYQSIRRVLEAHRVYQNIPGSMIVISGEQISTALMSKMLILLGVPEKRIIIESHSNTTWDSAINIKKFTSKLPFILVTSAVHMPRAMNCFIMHGLDPVAAPGDFIYGYYQSFTLPLGRNINYYIPNAVSLENVNSVLHEYAGLFWYRIKYFLEEQ